MLETLVSLAKYGLTEGYEKSAALRKFNAIVDGYAFVQKFLDLCMVVAAPKGTKFFDQKVVDHFAKLKIETKQGVDIRQTVTRYLDAIPFWKSGAPMVPGY